MRLTLALLLLLGGVARAETSAEARAREHYRRGTARYQLAEFEKAIDEFKRAFQLTQAPALLFDLGQASRLNKDFDLALYYYQTYLRVFPRAPNREDVERLIAWCERQQRRVSDDTRALASVGPIVEPTTSELVPMPVSSDDGSAQRLRRELKIGAGITGALGVAALAAGVGLGVRSDAVATQLSQIARDQERWGAGHDALYREGEREAAAATALYVIGGVSLATGLVLAIVAARKAAPRIEPAIARRPAVTLAWEF